MVELTQEDIEFFKNEGYLIKRNVLNPELMERARTRLWEGAPEGRHREDPDTWVGPFKPDEENEDNSNRRKGFRWNFREPGGRGMDGEIACYRSERLAYGRVVFR